MQLQRPLAAVVLGAALTSCGFNPGPAEEGALAGRAQASFAPPAPAEEEVAPVTYDVPDSSCPKGWSGLEVTTDGDAGVGDLDDVVACTDGKTQRTYLENRSKAVWLLSAATVTPSLAVRLRPTPSETSFLRIVRATRGQEALAPGSVMTTNTPPDQVSWAPDLALTFAWEAHAMTAASLASLGRSYVADALTRRNQAGNALVACTLAVHASASSGGDLAGADAARVVLAGLGSARCRGVAGDAGVADEIGKLRSQTQRWPAVTADLRAAGDWSRALPDGAHLLTR